MSARRWWWGGAVVLLLVPVGALAVLVAQFDPNSLKPTLIEAARNATGRTLDLNGDLRLSPSLWPTLEASDVRLANLPGGSRPDMARAERVLIALDLPALLHREIAITQLTLIGPNILFEQVAGKPNWRFDLPNDPAPAPSPAPAAAPYQLQIRDTQIRNGMVTWRLPARTKVLGIRTMAVRHHSFGGPVEFGGTFVYGDNQPFQLTGSALPTAGLAGPWNTRLDLAAFDTQASASGTMDTAGTYDLQLEATAAALEKLNALLPEMRLPVMHQVKLSARLGNGRQPGDFPVIGATSLHFASADLGNRVPGLTLGPTNVTIDKPGGTATLATAGLYTGQAFSLGGTTGMPVNPDTATSLAIDLVLKAGAGGKGANFTLGLKGKVAVHALAFAGLDATATLTTPALAGLRALGPDTLPALTGLHAEAHLVLPENLGSAVFRAMRLTSKEGDLAGDGTMTFAPPALTAKLRSGTLDADAVLTAFGIDPWPSFSRTPGRTVLSDSPLPWSLLHGPALDVTGTIGALSYGREQWRGVDVAVLLKAGHLQRGTLSLASAGGPISLAVTANATVTPVPVTFSLDAPALPLSLVARYAGLPGLVTGSARMEARLRGAGASLHELAATLDGTASLSAVDGQLTNEAFIQLTGPSLSALGIKVPAQGETVLRCIAIGAALQRGVGKLSPIALETSYLSLEGAGQIDLGRETVALRLKPLAVVSGATVSVPVVVQGPFRNIEGHLDANAFDKAGLFIDALFGGNSSTACADAGLVPRAE